ncbi:hypothetical protein ACFQY8_01770 [Alloscardovia venturai]|uniref:MASE1 domain-containing protein n=1 Tax=Alloscardovia venturai TaxID=1769421 RepID=A0ABW2Y4S0_9BIFI
MTYFTINPRALVSVLIYALILGTVPILSLFLLHDNLTAALWWYFAALIVTLLYSSTDGLRHGAHIIWIPAAFIGSVAAPFAWPSSLSFTSVGTIVGAAFIGNLLGSFTHLIVNRQYKSGTPPMRWWKPYKGTVIGLGALLVLWVLPAVIAGVMMNHHNGLGIGFVITLLWTILAIFIPYFSTLLYGINIWWILTWIPVILASPSITNAFHLTGLGFGYFSIFAALGTVSAGFGELMRRVPQDSLYGCFLQGKALHRKG